MTIKHENSSAQHTPVSSWRPRVSLRLLFLILTILCLVAYLIPTQLYVTERVGFVWGRFVSGDSTSTAQAAEDWLLARGFQPTDDSPRLAESIHGDDGPIPYVFFQRQLPSGRLIFAGLHTSDAVGSSHTNVLFANDWRELRWKTDELARDHQLVSKLSEDFQNWFKSYNDERLRSRREGEL